MSRFERTADNPINWSFRIGRLFAIDIRIHILFILAAVVLLSMEAKAAKELGLGLGAVLRDTAITYALLFLIVLLHEFGHCFGSRSTGGEADEILLWPLGGLAMVNPPHTARAHLITTLAGPAVNVVICLIAAAVLIVWTGNFAAVPWNPLSPVWPVDATFSPSVAQFWVMRVFGLSYILLLFNMLLPFYPFDGGRALQSFLWGRKGYRRSMEIATSVGMIGAIALALFSLFTEHVWLLLCIAAFGYFACYQQRRALKEGIFDEMGEMGYDFSQGYRSLERQCAPEDRVPGYFERRRQRKAARKAEQRRQRELQREQEVERILAKVSNHGLASLTSKERRFLQEETARKREQTP